MRSRQMLDDLLSGVGKKRKLLDKRLAEGKFWGRRNLICFLTNLFRTLLFPAHQANHGREMRFFPEHFSISIKLLSPFASTSIAEVEKEILKMLPVIHAWLADIVSICEFSSLFSEFSSATGFHSAIIHDLCLNANIKHEHKSKFYQLKWRTKKTFFRLFVVFLFSLMSSRTPCSEKLDYYTNVGVDVTIKNEIL